jgi:chromosomal replication initiator protein
MWRQNLYPRWTFDTFVVGPCNQRAYKAAKAVAQTPGFLYNPLIICGETGLGGTHLMQAIGHRILAGHRASLVWISSHEMLCEYSDALQDDTLAQFRQKYCRADALLLDAIQYFNRRHPLPKEFARIFRVLLDAHKQIVITSDRSPRKVPGFGRSLTARFARGLTVKLGPPDLATKVAILRQKLKLEQIKLPDECVLYIAKRVRSNIRSLETAFYRATTFAAASGQEMTLPILKKLLRNWE